MRMQELISDQIIFQASKIRFIDLRIEGQVHTNWTDGHNSIFEMQNSAQAKNLRALVFSEHTSIGSGNWYLEFVQEINDLYPSDLKIYSGTEVKIKNYFGELNLDQDVARMTQVVLASVHRFPDVHGEPIEFSEANRSFNSCESELQLMIAAIKRKESHIIAHPFGMSLTKFQQRPTEAQWDQLIASALKYEVALEFNSKYHKSDFTILERYIANNCLISIGSDAHSVDEVGDCSSQIIQYLGIQ